MTRSPRSISGWSAPHDPTRMKVGRSVIARISATTISTLSVPIPVDTTDTRWPRYVPVAEANSRCRCSSSMESKREAIREVRSGSPGRRMYSASLPVRVRCGTAVPLSGIAMRRSLGLSTRVSAFGKTSPSLTWRASLARNSGEDSPAILRASSTAHARFDARTTARSPTHGARSRTRRSPRAAADRAADRRQPGRHPGAQEPARLASAERSLEDGQRNDPGRRGRLAPPPGRCPSRVRDPALACPVRAPGRADPPGAGRVGRRGNGRTQSAVEAAAEDDGRTGRPRRPPVDPRRRERRGRPR